MGPAEFTRWRFGLVTNKSIGKVDVMRRLPGRIGELAARDVMTRDVITVSEDDTLARAVQTFQREHITGAPVVNAEGKLAGILSLSDLLPPADPGAAAPEAAGSPREGLHHSNRGAWQLLREHPTLSGDAPGGLVRDRMSSEVVSVRDIAPLIEAARIMCVGHWHRVPVVDAYDTLCGIISTMDVLAALVNAADEAG